MHVLPKTIEDFLKYSAVLGALGVITYIFENKLHRGQRKICFVQQLTNFLFKEVFLIYT